MRHEDIYSLSKRFSPPRTDLRKAKILDDYGDDSYSKLKITHKLPDDVTRKEFDYYGWVYPFMDAEDLLFYLYAIVIEYEDNRRLECIDSFMYSMDRKITDIQKILSDEENKILKNAFQLIWNIGGNDWVDWAPCINLQRLLGISIE